MARDSKENPKAMWSYLKQNRSNRVSVGPLKDGDSLVTDDKEMAELLNNAFQKQNIPSRASPSPASPSAW